MSRLATRATGTQKFEMCKLLGYNAISWHSAYLVLVSMNFTLAIREFNDMLAIDMRLVDCAICQNRALQAVREQISHGAIRETNFLGAIRIVSFRLLTGVQINMKRVDKDQKRWTQVIKLTQARRDHPKVTLAQDQNLQALLTAYAALSTSNFHVSTGENARAAMTDQNQVLSTWRVLLSDTGVQEKF